MEKVNQRVTNANVVLKTLQTPEGMLAQIELFVGLVAFLLLFLAGCGSLRRRHNNPMLQVVLWAAYTLSGYLITYTFGLMHESPFSNPLFPLWATFLMIFLGSSNSFSAYSLEDNEQWKKYAWQHMVRFVGLLVLWTSYLTTLPLTLVVFLLYFIVMLLKANERALSLMTASASGLQRTTKWVADHMSSEHQLSNPCETDPVTMNGYKYVVRAKQTGFEKSFGEVAGLTQNSTKSLEVNEDVITTEKVWACKGRLLNSSEGDLDGKLKDICLSYALYLLLLLRFSGYSLPEEAHEKAWLLIREGILQKENGYERAFRVAEVELTFLHDFFYTNYPIIFQAGRLQLKMMEFSCLIIGTMLTVIFMVRNTTKREDDVVQFVTSKGLSVDVLVTTVILMVFTCVELVQLFLMAISEWAKVTLLCKYVQKGSWQESRRIEKLIGQICRTHLKPWGRNLRQCALLESYHYSPSRFLYNGFTIAFLDVVRRGQRQRAPVRLSPEVKKAVFRSLRNRIGKLENGQASLRLNNVSDELSWACMLETQTQVIMVWHIATSFLEHEVPVSGSNFLVATHLSKYLAYLVAFAPRLLPGHPYVAENVFDQIILEARKVLVGCKTDRERMERLKDIAQAPEETVMNWGAVLGIQLQKGNSERIWKILAEFWAELMLYVAPSDDAKAHAERLAKGGEFVTHLWALVSHAGIEQEPYSKPRTIDICDANMV
ncbi:uncharacterized protein LOC104443011 [Eucalyptus grandis]|uniref:uncharacterized protein LOC104443011 n=1 Tax=Eucalyptus grandis TaxID=71139 RepID=UPI00192EBC63|nr:uncharacterized protein LOC104443011 [Eucalyptus grandis]